MRDSSNSWVDTEALNLEGGHSRHVMVNKLDLHKPVVTLCKNENFSIILSPAPGETRALAVEVTVDGISARGAFMLGSAPYRVEGFFDSVSGTVKPFVTREIEVVEGESLRGQTAARDAMERAGKIIVKVWDTVPCEKQVKTVQVAADKKLLETTAKKALLNGLGTEAPSVSAGTCAWVRHS